MKAKLTFDCTDTDDEIELKRAIKAIDMAGILWEIRYNLKKRCEWKAEASEKPMDAYDMIEFVFGEIDDLFDEHNLIIDELYK
jgi:hypothetical protein